MSDEQMKQLMILAKKEILLNEIIVWLKAKGLWEECQKSLSIQITKL